MTPSWFSYIPIAITEELLKNAEQVTWAVASLSLRSGVCWAKGHCYLITVSLTGHLLLPLLSEALFNIVCAFPSMQSLHQQVLKALPLPPHYCCLPLLREFFLISTSGTSLNSPSDERKAWLAARFSRNIFRYGLPAKHGIMIYVVQYMWEFAYARMCACICVYVWVIVLLC